MASEQTMAGPGKHAEQDPSLHRPVPDFFLLCFLGFGDSEALSTIPISFGVDSDED